MIALTKFFEKNINQAFGQPMDSLDREFKGHLVFVFNQILNTVRKKGISEAALEKIGKLLFRLYLVLQAYKKKRKRYTLSEWIGKIAELGKELRNATG